MTQNSKYLALLLVQFLPFAFYYKYNIDDCFWGCIVIIAFITGVSYLIGYDEDIDNTDLRHRTFFILFGLLINSLIFLLI